MEILFGLSWVQICCFFCLSLVNNVENLLRLWVEYGFLLDLDDLYFFGEEFVFWVCCLYLFFFWGRLLVLQRKLFIICCDDGEDLKKQRIMLIFLNVRGEMEEVFWYLNEGGLEQLNDIGGLKEMILSWLEEN